MGKSYLSQSASINYTPAEGGLPPKSSQYDFANTPRFVDGCPVKMHLPVSAESPPEGPSIGMHRTVALSS
jgi:hypothetical protein